MAKGLPREVTHRLKYNQHEFFEPLLQEWLLRALQLDLNLKPLAIIPIPLHETKKRERGFNQANTIARILSSHIKVQIEDDLLRRVKATDSQTHLSRSKRISNVKNAFMCTHQIHKGCYLLVDDVITTGSTASACAKVLLENGASSNEIRVTAIPNSKDIVPVRNQILEIDFINTSVTGEVDTVAVGDSASGTTYTPTSSYTTTSSY